MFFIYTSIQIHFFSSRARADKVNEVGQHYRRQASLLLCLLLPYPLPPPPLGTHFGASFSVAGSFIFGAWLNMHNVYLFTGYVLANGGTLL